MAKRSKWLKLTTLAVVLVMLASVLVASCITTGAPTGAADTFGIREFTDAINTGRDQYLDSSVVYALPDSVKDSDLISVIIRTDEVSLMDTYAASDTSLSFGDYVYTDEANAFREQILEEKAEILADLGASSVSFTEGSDYSAVISGFEVVITAKDFEALCKTVGDRATPIVGEVYAAAETQLVENKVNFDEATGIFDSSSFAYDGTGIVVAVLDTGLDYTHSAFSLANFTADRNKLGLTFDEVSALVGDTVASKLTTDLTASDVYISQKVPYGYDYADRDSDVYPINSDHGTHVSGVIAGKDDTITGVAPNAQLVEMKIFSDVDQSARTSWILNALEDCVILGVDVINMSIGTSAGFSRATDKEEISGVYDKIRDAGISLVVAASNSFNSTYGSEKNGNLGLTSNPDSGTVGSPSTYEGALSIASISGVKTPYLLYDGQIIYFIESTDRFAEEKYFVDEILADGVDSKEFEYVTIPGAGRKADYTGLDVNGKIALVRRGTTTFEEKALAAQQMGAVGLIVYNNVAGDIKMNVGDADLAVASIRQDDGEMLAEQGSGTIKISRSQTSGPFMSDFSSWGPTPDLRIKPELTAHGGSILSAVPGQSYDRQSGTSMACPNVAGVVALMRQYLIESDPTLAEDRELLAARINQLLMSTADIVYNTNGLPYSVRKQGAGLANLNDAAATKAYIQTYDRLTQEIMNKSKIELGDDPTKSGVYTLKFSIVNFGSTALTYDLSAYVMTEGVSETLTFEGKTTVNEQGYLLEGATVSITALENGTQSGNQITVNAGKTADVTVTITLSDADKKYLDDSFANGMYVEGFVVLSAANEGGVTLSVPYLAYYGDWTVAPIFDLDYFDTNADELDDSIDLEDKTLPDAYATRPIGGLSADYVSYLGSFYFQQDPASANKIAADPKYISLSNQTDTINSLRFVWAGLLRSAERVEVTITEDATGEVVYTTTDYDIRKSYGDGASIYPANVDIEFSAIEHNLKNNTAYTVNLKAYLDYGEDGGADTNLKNEFSFPLVTDFSAPVVTGCEFYTEYDKSAKETRYFAKIDIYDNHYSMGMQVGYVGASGEEYILNAFDAYIQPIYSEFNSTTTVTYELTDCINLIKQNANIPGHENTITVACYDYALNQATYEIELPDEFRDVWFAEEEITLSPNEVYTLEIAGTPDTAWGALLDLSVTKSNGREIARVVNGKVLAVQSGECLVRYYDPATQVMRSLHVTVLSEGDEGYRAIDKPVVEDFRLTGYYTDKAFYYLNSEDRDIGMTGDERKFSGSSYSLAMFPSEAVTLRYVCDAYFPDDTTIVFESSNESMVKVDANGKITAVAEGYASVTMRVLLDGKNTYYSQTINIEVKDPFITSGPTLTNYFGAGTGNSGSVTFPSELAINAIGQYAFSNYDYIDKDENDEISDESPEYTKMWYLGNTDITEVIIPEGVESIGPYAFANLTALTKVVLPSTLKTIDYGAFYGCTSLQTVSTRTASGAEISGLINAQFINRGAFTSTALRGEITFGRTVAIADEAFALNTGITKITLSETTQSIGADAFYGNTALGAVVIKAEKVKLGRYVFGDCESLESIVLNAAVIPANAFDGCEKLKDVTLGKDVAVVGEYAFRGTRVESFTVAVGNTTFYAQDSKPYLLNANGDTILLVAPGIQGPFTADANITTVAHGAFSGNAGITSVTLPGVTVLKDYAFASCSNLSAVNLGTLTEIGNYAFFGTALTATPTLDSLQSIGSYAFAESKLTAVTIPDGMTVGESAFRECQALVTVRIGDDVVLGSDAFRLDRENNFFGGDATRPPLSYRLENGQKVYYYAYTSALRSLTIGDRVTIGNGAFYGAAELLRVTLGADAVIGDEAFYNADQLADIDLSKVVSIGKGAFSGDVLYDFEDSSFTTPALDEEGYYIYRYFAPDLKAIDLSALESLGEEAFLYNAKLQSVVLGSKLTAIPADAFNACESLTTIDLSGIVTVGDNAFYETALTSIDLSKATEIGKYAFVYNEELTHVLLNDAGVVIAEGAFAYCPALRTVTNLSKASRIDGYAFAYTAIDRIDLSSASYVGEHAFLKENPTKVTVVLGSSLLDVGDNPFANCLIDAFTTTVTETIHDKDYTETVDTFILNPEDPAQKLRVIDGSLYRTVPKGLEMITFAGDAKNVTVAENTVRIGAMAFAGTEVERVILPSTLASIGHKALYGCDALTLVSFQSYEAPILEEEYDINYFYSYENMPTTGSFTITTGVGDEVRHGLAITPYFMWNVTDLPTNAFYGANFVDYIGHVDSSFIMVRPVNGQHYDSFIFNQYFELSLDGAAAADSITLDAIAAIEQIPEKVTLADEATVLAARAAYDKITSIEQRALVSNYQTLADAEKRIATLKELENEGNGTEDDTSTPTDQTPGVQDPATFYTVLITGVAVAVVLLGGLTVYLVRRRKIKKDDPEVATEPAEKTETDSEPEEQDLEDK